MSSCPLFPLNPLAAFVLRDRPTPRIEQIRKDSFEPYAFDWLCRTTGVEREVLRAMDNFRPFLYKIKR